MDLRIGEILEITQPCARSARIFVVGILAVLQGEIVKKGVQNGVPDWPDFLEITLPWNKNWENFRNNSTMKKELAGSDLKGGGFNFNTVVLLLVGRTVSFLCFRSESGFQRLGDQSFTTVRDLSVRGGTGTVIFNYTH